MQFFNVIHFPCRCISHNIVCLQKTYADLDVGDSLGRFQKNFHSPNIFERAPAEQRSCSHLNQT